MSEIASKHHLIHPLLELHLSIVPVVMKNLHGTSQIALSLTSTLIARTNPQVNKTFSIHCDTFILLRLTLDFLMNKNHAFHEHKLLNDVEHTGLIFINFHTFQDFHFSCQP